MLQNANSWIWRFWNVFSKKEGQTSEEDTIEMKDIDELLGQFDFVKNARSMFSVFSERIHPPNNPQSDSWKYSSDARTSLVDSFQGLIAPRKKIESEKKMAEHLVFMPFFTEVLLAYINIARCGSSSIGMPEVPSSKFNCGAVGSQDCVCDSRTQMASQEPRSTFLSSLRVDSILLMPTVPQVKKFSSLLFFVFACFSV